MFELGQSSFHNFDGQFLKKIDINQTSKSQNKFGAQLSSLFDHQRTEHGTQSGKQIEKVLL